MKTAVIVGASATGKEVYEKVKGLYKVLYFTDGNPVLIGKEIDSLTIYPIEHIMNDIPDVVIMGIMAGYEEKAEYLVSLGIPEGKIICKYVDLSYRAREEFAEKIGHIFQNGGVSGEIAELGVYRGDFAKYLNKIFSNRKLYLFDTFEGFPDEDIEYEIKNNLLKKEVGRLTNTSVDYVLSRMTYPEKCIICKGYFPETANGLEEKFAFVNIDVTLYKPVLAGLEVFWPQMVEGGYILVRDYFANIYEGPKKAVDEFAKKYNLKFVPIGDGSSVAFVK